MLFKITESRFRFSSVHGCSQGPRGTTSHQGGTIPTAATELCSQGWPLVCQTFLDRVLNPWDRLHWDALDRWRMLWDATQPNMGSEAYNHAKPCSNFSFHPNQHKIYIHLVFFLQQPLLTLLSPRQRHQQSYHRELLCLIFSSVCSPSSSSPVGFLLLKGSYSLPLLPHSSSKCYLIR